MDPLEETLDVWLPVGMPPNGVYRTVFDAEVPGGIAAIQHAPELSTRYEVPRINLTARQAE